MSTIYKFSNVTQNEKRGEIEWKTVEIIKVKCGVGFEKESIIIY
jgi:hypothetical protein